jgi:excinuclease ABC subunit A
VTGTPETVAAHPTSHTGRFLAEVLGTLPLEPVRASREA